MRKWYVYFIIAIVPIILLTYSLSLRKAQGPFFFNTHYDPTYAYLVSSLNLSELKDVNFYVHPGTPVQIIGAIVIKSIYFFQPEYTNPIDDVLSKPELYLYAILAVLILINSLSLFLIGLMVYKATKNIFLVILLQLTPFISFTIAYELSMVNSEIFIIPVTLFLIALSIKFISGFSLNKGKYYYEILFALICGIGMATKLTFFALFLIPLILIPGMKRKFLFLTLTFIFFFIFIFPVYATFSNFLLWIKNLFLYSGKYGTGSADVVDSSAAINNIKTIFTSERYFTITYISVLIFLIVSLFKFFRKKIMELARQDYKLLISLFLSMTFMTIVVAKQYTPRYMIPALLLCPVSLYLMMNIILRVTDLRYKIVIRNTVCAIFAFYILYSPFKDSVRAMDWTLQRKTEAEKVNEFLKKNYPDAKVLTCFGSSSIEFASAFLLPFAGSQKKYYENILNKKYSNQLFFEPWVKKIHSIKGTDNVKEILNSDGKLILKIILLEGFNQNSLEDIKKELIDTYNFKNPEFVNVYQNDSKESLYEVILK